MEKHHNLYTTLFYLLSCWYCRLDLIFLATDTTAFSKNGICIFSKWETWLSNNLRVWTKVKVVVGVQRRGITSQRFWILMWKVPLEAYFQTHLSKALKNFIARNQQTIWVYYVTSNVFFFCVRTILPNGEECQLLFHSGKNLFSRIIFHEVCVSRKVVNN